MNPPRRFFGDTSFFYACMDAADADHEAAQELAVAAAAEGSVVHATWDVVSETVTLLRYRLGARAALDFLNRVKPGLKIVRYGDAVRTAAEQLFRRYSRDHRLSFCDAISYVVIATLLDSMPCASFDADFRSLGLTVIP